jgi:hypothetical protein
MVDDSLTSVNVFSHYMKVKIFLHIFIMCYFYDLEKPETFAFPKGIVGDLGRELSKSHKTGPVSEKMEVRVPKVGHICGAQPHSFSFLFPSVQVLLHHKLNSFSDQFNCLLRAGFRVHLYDVLSLCFCFCKRSKPGSS